MKKMMITGLVAVMLSLVIQAQEVGATVKKVYDETIDPIEQIDNALAQARAEGKFVIAQVGGNWCPWCLRFADYITRDPEISQIVAENFVYIHVNYHPRKNKDNARAQQMLKRLGNCGRFGYPVLVVLNQQGDVIHIQDSSYLEQDKSYNHDKVMSFFKHWTPSAVNAE